jgi:alginate O-acetyltransferase complex protein AlgJ
MSKWLAAIAACIPLAVHSADPPAGVVGKDGWLFYRYELIDPSLAADSRTTVQLIARLASVLARNDIALLVTLVPVKMRIYASHLPDDFKLTPYMNRQYDELADLFRARKVKFADLNGPFLASPKRDGDTPLFLRLDTHWSPVGALAAAEAIKSAIDADPALKSIVDAVPARKATLTWSPQQKPLPVNDLVPQLPKGAPSFPPETVLSFTVEREKIPTGLLDDAAGPRITLVGSSYSSDWTLFPDALRYALQRDVLSISVPANRGSWAGIESYLRDESFQGQPPKLIVWEWPERDMHAPPDFRYREARYRIDNTEWLLRAAAWATFRCDAASATVKSMTGKLATPGASTDSDFVEISFSRPLDKLEYFSAQVLTDGSARVRIEATGPGAKPRTFDVESVDAAEAHVLKTPLFSGGKGYDKVRLYPGKTHRFSVAQARVCRQMEGLLE